MSDTTVRLSVSSTSISLTTSTDFLCQVKIYFTATSAEMAESIATKLDGLEIGTGSTLHAEALEVLQAELEETKHKHAEEIDQHLRAATIQNRELIQLREMLRRLGHIVQC